MRAARSWHESSQECSAAQQHGTSQDEGASHGYRSRSSNFAAQLGIEWSGISLQTAANTQIIAHASMQMDLLAAAFRLVTDCSIISLNCFESVHTREKSLRGMLARHLPVASH